MHLEERLFRADPVGVTVVVVCFNAREHIHACLTSLLQQEYDGDWELVVVDNGSTDGTRSLLTEFACKHTRLKIIDNPVRGISVSRNLGWRSARFDFVAYTDSDCVVPPRWLMTLVAGLLRYDAQAVPLAAVGGGNAPPADHSPFYTAHGLFLNSYLGSHGSVQGRKYPDDRPVPHLPTVNVLYKRQVLQAVNGFDVGFYNIGEDRDLSYRLEESGYTLYYLADCVITHFQRPGFQSWFHNMFVYGKGRLWLMRRHPGRIDLVLLAPMLLVALLFAGYWLWPLLLAYAVVLFLYAGLLCFRAGEPKSLWRVWVLFIGTHVCYGLGQWYGVFRHRPGLGKRIQS